MKKNLRHLRKYAGEFLYNQVRSSPLGKWVGLIQPNSEAVTTQIRIGKTHITPIDLMSEHFLFGHRIALGKLIEANDDVALMEGTMYELYGVHVKPKHYIHIYSHVQEVVQALVQWVEKEKQLAYTPTAEEEQAGIAKISEKLKEFATIDAISTRTGMSHDSVLKLPYSTVFMMLLADLEKSKFERRLHKIYEQKYKH